MDLVPILLSLLQSAPSARHTAASAPASPMTSAARVIPAPASIQTPQGASIIDSILRAGPRPDSAVVLETTHISSAALDSIIAHVKNSTKPAAAAGAGYKTFTVTNKRLSQATLIDLLRDHGATEGAAKRAAPGLMRALQNPALRQVAIVTAAGGGVLAVVEWANPGWSSLARWGIAAAFAALVLLLYRLLRRRRLMT